MAYTKTTWVNNSSPYINADNLNKIENQLETNTNDIETNTTNIQTNTENITTNANNISNLSTYSATEKVIGKWIDNKPLYRKVIYISSLPNTSQSTYSININNLEDFISISGIASNGSTFFVLPSYRADDVSGIELFVNINNGITIKTGMDRTGYHANIILEYTKTTD